MADAKTLVYLSSNYHRIYDRCKNLFKHNLVTVNNQFGRFDSKSNCLDFSKEENKGLVLVNSLDITNEAFTIAAWVKSLADKDSTNYKFCFIGNQSSKTDLDGWIDENVEVVSKEVVSTTETTKFLTSDTNLITGAVLNDKDWHHIVITRLKNVLEDGTESEDTDTIISFIDGKKVSSTTLGTDKKFITEGFSIGSSGEEDSFYGYMDDFVFIKNLNLWTDEFVPPTDYLPNIHKDTIRTNMFKDLGSWTGSSLVNTTDYNDMDVTDLLELERSFQIITTA